MSLELVTTEIDDKIGFVVIPVVVHAAPQAFLPNPLCGFTYGGVITDGLGTVGGHKIIHGGCLASLVPAVLVHEQFGCAGIPQWFELGRDCIQGLIPGNAFPFVLTSFSDSLHRVQNTVGKVNLVDPGLSSRAEFTEGADRVRISFKFLQASVLYIADGRIPGYTLPAGGRYRLELFTGRRRKTAPPFLELDRSGQRGLTCSRPGCQGTTSSSKFHKFTTVYFTHVYSSLSLTARV